MYSNSSVVNVHRVAKKGLTVFAEACKSRAPPFGIADQNTHAVQQPSRGSAAK